MEKHFVGLELVAPYNCEFLGTFFLTFTVCLCAMFGSAAWNATAIASALMAAVYAFGPISGGHLNPAVSLSFLFSRKANKWKVLQYILSQFLGGIFAGLMVAVTYYNVDAPPVGPGASFNWFEAIVIEVIYTAMLCFVVLNCATSERNNPESDRNQFYALAIGFVIIAGGYAGGAISGGMFNPAVTLGLQLVRSNAFVGFFNVFWYMVAHALGACLGAAAFALCRVEDYEAPGNSEAKTLFMAEYQPPLVIRIITEFIGTLMVVITFGLNVMQGNPATAWSTAACVMSLMYSVSNISGGHFNPAVTLGVFLSGRRKCHAKDATLYIIVQFIAGILAAGVLAILLHSANLPALGLAPGKGFNWAQALMTEAIFTMILVYVVLAVATMETVHEFTYSRHNFFFGLAVGACYTVGGVAVGAITGGSLNPASSLGVALCKFMSSEVEGLYDESATTTTPTPGMWIPGVPLPENCGFYILYELCGAAVAALVFHCTHAREYRHYMEITM